MSNKRWGSDDKIELMRLYALGRSYEEIGKILDRSPNAIKLRLEAIVYENLIKGKPLNLLSRMLNTDKDTIKQFYYSHKSFLQGQGEEVQDVMFPPDTATPIGTNTSNVNINRHLHRAKDEQHRTKHDKDTVAVYPTTHSLSRSSVPTSISTSSVERKLHRIENENHILEEIIKNYKMKRQVRKLYVDGKLDNKSIEMYEKLLKS